MGFLVIPMDSRFILNDGQHRRAAIERALERNPELRYETISVVFFIDAGQVRPVLDQRDHALRVGYEKVPDPDEGDEVQRNEQSHCDPQ